MLLVDENSKYKMCPKCGLSNNPIDDYQLRCRVCGYTTNNIDCVNADVQWNFTGLNKHHLIWNDAGSQWNSIGVKMHEYDTSNVLEDKIFEYFAIKGAQ